MERSEYIRIFANEKTHFWYRANREFSLDLIDKYCHLTKKSQILDAGCGVGGTTIVLKKYGQVTGVDINDLALKYSRKYPINYLIKANINKLPLEDNSFDLITSFDVIYHRNVDPQKAIGEMYRVLKKGGWILVRVPAFEFLRGSHDTVVQTGRRFTVSQLAELVSASGLKIHYLSYFNFVLFFPSLLWRHVKLKPSSDITKIWPPLNYFLYIILKLESRFALMFNIPFGTSVYCLSSKS